MSIETLPQELLEQIIHFIDPPDRLNLGLCSPYLSIAVARTDLHCFKPNSDELDDIVFEKGGVYLPDGSDLRVHLATGVDLRVARASGRLDAMRTRGRLCNQIYVNKVVLRNVKLDDTTLLFVRALLQQTHIRLIKFEMEKVQEFHPCVIPFINEFSDRAELRVSELLQHSGQLLQLHPVQRLVFTRESHKTRPRGLIDDARLMAMVKQRHAFLDLSVCRSRITARGLRALLVNLARSPRRQTVLFTADGWQFNNFMETIGYQYPDNEGYEQPEGMKQFLVHNFVNESGIWRTSALRHRSALLEVSLVPVKSRNADPKTLYRASNCHDRLVPIQFDSLYFRSEAHKDVESD